MDYFHIMLQFVIYRLNIGLVFLVPVSSGRTVIKFHANSPDLLSFNMDQPVKIFSKGAGRDRELWGVEVSHE